MFDKQGIVQLCWIASSLLAASGCASGAAVTSPGANRDPSGGLAGTSWQLVKFQSSDDTTLTPDDRAKYTLSFTSDGVVTARLDCNRGRGSWTSTQPNELRFGPLALTRAQCPPGSLHDHIAKHWEYVRSYTLANGHLFLSLMADGGVYEFEPATVP